MQGKTGGGEPMEVIGENEREDHTFGLSSTSSRSSSLLSPTPDMSQSLNGLIRRNYSQVFPEPMENLKPLDREHTNTPEGDSDTPIEPLPPLRSIFGDIFGPPSHAKGGFPASCSSPTPHPFSNSSPAAFPMSSPSSVSSPSPVDSSHRTASAPSPVVTFSTEPPAAYLSQMTSIPPRVGGSRPMSTDSSQPSTFGGSAGSSSSGGRPSPLAFSASDSASFLSLIRASTEDEGNNNNAPTPHHHHHHNPHHHHNHNNNHHHHHNPHHQARLSNKLSNKLNHRTTFYSDPCHPSMEVTEDMDDPMGDGMNEEHTSGRGPRVCSVCGTNSTPRWRRGPRGRQTLCNSCGLKFIRKKKKEMKGRGD